MIKRMIALINIVLCLGVMIACNGQEQPQGGKDTASEPVAAGESISGKTKDAKDISFKMIYQTGNLGVSNAGYYEIYDNLDGSGNILYTDVETKQRIYLSPDISSDHQSAADPSWIESTLGGVTVFAAGDSLFIQKNDFDDFGALYRAELNGGNRVKLLDFVDYESWFSSIAGDGENLYTLLTKRTGGCFLVKISMADGTIEPLYQMPYEINFLQSVYDDCILIQSTVRPDPEEYSDGDEIYENTEFKVYRYAVTSNQLDEVLQWKMGNMEGAFDHSSMYIFDYQKDCLKVYDFRDDTETIRIESLKEKGISGDGLSIDSVRDDHLAYDVDGSSFIMDLSTLEIQERLCMEDSYMYPIILGAFGDKYMVTAGELEIPYDDFDPAGNPIINTRLVSRLALIDSDDYWNSEYNFERIRDTFLGE